LVDCKDQIEETPIVSHRTERKKEKEEDDGARVGSGGVDGGGGGNNDLIALASFARN
jgi:hypothetical protein